MQNMKFKCTEELKNFIDSVFEENGDKILKYIARQTVENCNEWIIDLTTNDVTLGNEIYQIIKSSEFYLKPFYVCS